MFGFNSGMLCINHSFYVRDIILRVCGSYGEIFLFLRSLNGRLRIFGINVLCVKENDKFFWRANAAGGG